jgi:molecular chaperone Hsp33
MNGLLSDCIRPFQIETSGLRGRLVRLGPELDGILGRHAYPAPVARFLAETLTLATLLSAMLKYDGVFTLQGKGDGPLKLLVADVTSEGKMRAFAQYDAAAFEGELGARMTEDAELAPAAALLGKGYLAFTVDQGENTERYQGIVELYGKTLADCVQHYFRQSEQIDTGVAVAAELTEAGWRAGGVMLQRMPEEGGTAPILSSADEDGWRRAMVLLSSATPQELIGAAVAGDDLLYRLFHQDGVRAYPAKLLSFGCRCSDERVRGMLKGLARDDIDHLKVDGKVEVSCQFCSTVYSYDDAALAEILAE